MQVRSRWSCSDPRLMAFWHEAAAQTAAADGLCRFYLQGSSSSTGDESITHSMTASESLHRLMFTGDEAAVRRDIERLIARPAMDGEHHARSHSARALRHALHELLEHLALAELLEYHGDRLNSAEVSLKAATLRSQLRETSLDPATGLLREEESYPVEANLLAIRADLLDLSPAVALARLVERSGQPPHQWPVDLATLLETLRHVLIGAAQSVPATVFLDVLRTRGHEAPALASAYMLRAVAGLTPAAPGWASVEFDPQPGDLDWLDASLPIPAGIVRVQLSFGGGGLSGRVELPAGVAVVSIEPKRLSGVDVQMRRP